jgi:hypothetical protein
LRNWLALALGLTLALALGFALGWLKRDWREPYFYSTTQDVALQLFPHGIIGIVPKGTLVEAERRLAQHSDVGSTACLRIGFGSNPTETETLLVLSTTGRRAATKAGASTLQDAGLRPGARFDIEGPSVIKPSVQQQEGASKVP